MNAWRLLKVQLHSAIACRCSLAQRSCEQELSKLKQQMNRDVASLGFSGMTQSLPTSPITTPPMSVGVASNVKEKLREVEAVSHEPRPFLLLDLLT